jgi:MFS family permease
MSQSSASAMDPTSHVSPHKRAMRAGIAGFVGTTIQYYDFYVYMTAAAIVFPTVFFPQTDHMIGAIAALSANAIAFFVRPLGGIIFGHVGDKFGRKPALVVTLVMMGVATVAVGVLPSYDTAGIVAPILLIVFRIAQGLAVGGEWGGAALMAVEQAPESHKVFYGGFTQLGNPAGALLSSGAFWVFTLGDNDDLLMSWGWRVPFIASVILIAVGFWVRTSVEESQVFEEKVEGREQSAPLVFALKNNWLPIIFGVMIVAIPTGGYYLSTTFVQTYAIDVGVTASVILGAMTVASFLEFIVTLPLAWLADKWGGKVMMYLGMFFAVFTVVPLILVIEGGQTAMIYIFVAAGRVALSGTWAPLASLMSQMFRPQSRYTSVSLASTIGDAIWGGLVPVIGPALIATTGSVWAVVAFYVLLTIVAVIGTRFAPQHSDAATVTRSLNARLETAEVSVDDTDFRAE